MTTTSHSLPHPPSILLVEDEDAFRMVLCRTLEKAGYLVRVTDNGCSAWEMLKDELPDILLLDLGLPCKDGSAILHDLAHSGQAQQLQIIIMTAGYMRPEDEWLRQHGKLIRKPVLLPDVLRMIEKVSPRAVRGHAEAANQ
ncbi:MAG: response regulator [Anaerolineales bacterium]